MINPWDILAWVAVICLSILIISCTASVIIALVKPKTTGQVHSRRIL